MKPILRNISNNEAYEFLGGNGYRNLRTGKEGEVPEEKAKNVFKFNIEATELINEYPLIETMIKQLNLRLYVGSVSVQG